MNDDCHGHKFVSYAKLGGEAEMKSVVAIAPAART